jgi:hypothetical protein
LALSGGSLSIANSLNTPQFSQTGGALTGAGSMTVNGSFSQIGGTIAMGGPVSITQTVGNLRVGELSGSAISLAAPTGGMGQVGALVTSGLLSTQSMTGVVLNHAGNRVGAFQAITTGTGNVELTNVGILDVRGITVTNGNVKLVNTGGIRTSGVVVAHNGSVSMTANSPLTIGSGGVSASGDVVLNATNLTSSGNLTLDGPISSSAGAVTMNAASNFVQNSSVTAASGVTSTAGGSMTYGAMATTVGSPVSYTANGTALSPPPTSLAPVIELVGAAPIDYVVTFEDKFEAAVIAQNYAESVSSPSVAPTDSAPSKAKAADEDPLKAKRKNKDDVVVEGQTCTP